MGEPFKLMNLDLERVYCENIRSEKLEKRYISHLHDYSSKEFESEFLMGEERIDEVFGLLTNFIEETLFKTIIYAQTTRMLKFYKNYLRKHQAKVLFLQIEGDAG